MLAAAPRWDLARVAAIPGRSRGDLLGPWGHNVVRRFGADALARVRARLGAPLDRLTETLTSRDWLPAYAQPVVTEAIVDELLGGDLRALYPLLVEDTRAGLGRVQLVLVRSMGAARALRLTPRTVRQVYECGTTKVDAEVEVTGQRARIRFTGSPLFTHPTWRLLQLFATRTLLELAGSPGTATGEDAGPEGFVAEVTW